MSLRSRYFGAASSHRVFAEYYPSYVPLVTSVIAVLVGKDADVEGLVQETFVNFLAALHSGRGIRSPVSYLKTAAHNIALDHLARAGTKRELLATRDTDWDTWIKAATKGDSNTAYEYVEVILTMRKTLSRQLMLCLFMRTVLNMDRREIANILGITPGTVTDNVKKATDTIKAEFNRDAQKWLSTGLEGGRA